MAVFLGSKLSKAEQHQLTKLGELLGGRTADAFSGSGTICLVQKPGRQLWCLFTVKQPKR